MTRLFSKRVGRLEAQYGLGQPSDGEILLLARIKAGLRRAAENRGLDHSSHYIERPKRELSGMSITDILHAGRDRESKTNPSLQDATNA